MVVAYVQPTTSINRLHDNDNDDDNDDDDDDDDDDNDHDDLFLICSNLFKLLFIIFQQFEQIDHRESFDACVFCDRTNHYRCATGDKHRRLSGYTSGSGVWVYRERL